MFIPHHRTSFIAWDVYRIFPKHTKSNALLAAYSAKAIGVKRPGIAAFACLVFERKIPFKKPGIRFVSLPEDKESRFGTNSLVAGTPSLPS